VTHSTGPGPDLPGETAPGAGGGQSWARDVLDFWFSRGKRDWWRGSAEFDAEIKDRFGIEWARQSRRQVEDFLGDADTALAAVILFDQFPRNMFRGHADQFSTDHLALAIARSAVDEGFDEELEPTERGFLYMPFQHSESLAEQKRSLLLFTELGDADQLGYAQKHHDVIARFGRFPHRNKILGRAPRPDEIAAGDVVPW
jgi:uncharacterized protein (DUF924 family)